MPDFYVGNNMHSFLHSGFTGGGGVKHKLV